MDASLSTLTPLFQMVQSLGNWILFFWLFLQSQKDLKEARQAHMDDLRQIASVEPTLKRGSALHIETVDSPNGKI